VAEHIHTHHKFFKIQCAIFVLSKNRQGFACESGTKCCEHVKEGIFHEHQVSMATAPNSPHFIKSNQHPLNQRVDCQLCGHMNSVKWSDGDQTLQPVFPKTKTTRGTKSPGTLAMLMATPSQIPNISPCQESGN
jgi:hypothetical protein